MVKCSFCGVSESKTVPVISGLHGNICKECNETMLSMFEDMSEPKKRTNGLLKPHEIKEELDKYVIGQEEAKKILSVAVYNHYKRLNSRNSNVEIQKSNIIMIGPTGSGKTLLLQTLADIIDVPLVIADATSLTEHGYIGDDVDVLIESLLIKANNDVKRAEKGIIYVDEADKIATLSDAEGRGKDAGGRGVQEALLKMIEGSQINVTIGANVATKQRVSINTKNILFVFGGAFVGLDEIIKKRTNPKNQAQTIGFAPKSTTPQKTTLQNEVTHQDLIEYGFIPEFVGRIPLIATLNPLTKNDLSDILTKPKNSILKQYQELFLMDGVKLKFTKDAVDYIANEAIARKVGARGLKSIIEKSMYELMYKVPQHEDVKQITISKEMIMGKAPLIPEKVVNEQ